MKQLLGVIMVQMLTFKRMKKQGEWAVATLIKELKQLEQGVVKGNPADGPINPDDLSEDDKKKA